MTLRESIFEIAWQVAWLLWQYHKRMNVLVANNDPCARHHWCIFEDRNTLLEVSRYCHLIGVKRIWYSPQLDSAMNIIENCLCQRMKKYIQRINNNLTWGNIAVNSATATRILSAQGTKASRWLGSCIALHSSWIRLVTCSVRRVTSSLGGKLGAPHSHRLFVLLRDNVSVSRFV